MVVTYQGWRNYSGYKQHRKIFWGDVILLYFDCGSLYDCVCQNAQDYFHMDEFYGMLIIAFLKKNKGKKANNHPLCM